MSNTYESSSYDTLKEDSFSDSDGEQTPGYKAEEPGVPTDLLDLYFDQLGQTDLLTAEEEVCLAQAIEAGKEAEARLSAGDQGLKQDERAEIERAAREGLAAREHFVSANLRLVVAEAAKHQRRSRLELNELIQEGNIGLIRAVEKFDWRRGFKFSTYATWWIRQAIQRGNASTERTIRLPMGQHSNLMKVRAASSRLESETGSEATIGEIAAATNLTEEQVMGVRGIDYAITSLDQTVGHNDDAAELGEFVAVAPDDPAEEVISSDLNEWIFNEAASILGERPWYVLVCRYGLDGQEAVSLDAIGKELGVSRETIRKIENQALEKLRRKFDGLETQDAA